ncbi:hypothetical protein GCM10008995_03340 [Halobellus salinus]|uniref:Uncharacterized protein n=1 Tax=Halobellus salinus TaxID=931585 RepID=A0A830EK25_9EURY|nr:hypothetical protein GCM10008995_03340 [Halobellus salinus]
MGANSVVQTGTEACCVRRLRRKPEREPMPDGSEKHRRVCGPRTVGVRSRGARRGAAGLIAALPDVDVAYAVIAVDGGRFLGGGSVRPDVFWNAANAVHRSMTHSLAVAAVAGPALGLWSSRSGRRVRRYRGGARKMSSGRPAVRSCTPTRDARPNDRSQPYAGFSRNQ